MCRMRNVGRHGGGGGGEREREGEGERERERERETKAEVLSLSPTPIPWNPKVVYSLLYGKINNAVSMYTGVLRKTTRMCCFFV